MSMSKGDVTLSTTPAFRKFCQDNIERAGNYPAIHTAALYECAHGNVLSGDKLAYWRDTTEGTSAEDLLMIDPLEMPLRVIGYLIRGESALAKRIMNALTVQNPKEVLSSFFLLVKGEWWISVPLPQPKDNDDDERTYFGPLFNFVDSYRDWLTHC
jgi:hypothetical protein